MGEVIDLADRMARFHAKREAKQQERSAVASVQQRAVNRTKAADWAAVQDNHPDQAALITAVCATFGKPARIRVRDGSGIVMDTDRYA